MKYITCLLLSVGLIACNNNTQEAGPVINEPNNKLVMDWISSISCVLQSSGLLDTGAWRN